MYETSNGYTFEVIRNQYIDLVIESFSGGSMVASLSYFDLKAMVKLLEETES